MRFSRLTLALPILVSVVPSAGAAGIEAFKDWMIGCDNTRSCTAIGHAGEEFVGGNGYVVVRRDAGPAAAAAVDVVLYLETPAKGVDMTLSVDDPKAGLLPKGTTRLDDDGYLRTSFAGDAATALIAALRNVGRLQVTPRPGGADAGAAVSLSGMSAALLKMDDLQGRVGTSTALVRGGPKPASAVPAAPPIPVVVAMPMAALAGDAPKSVPRQPADETGCTPDTQGIGAALSPKQALWGVCTSAGAYNYFYDFYVVEGGKARPVAFPQPPGTGEASGSLTNPDVDDGGKTISEFDKGRGIGDCGVVASWAWDGTAFRLVEYDAMDDCVGIAPADWLTLWRAEAR